MSYIQERKDTRVYYKRPPWRGVTNKFEPFQCRHLLCGGFTHSSYRASQKRCFFRFKKDRNHHEQQMWLHNQCNARECQACKHWRKKDQFYHTKAMQNNASVKSSNPFKSPSNKNKHPNSSNDPHLQSVHIASPVPIQNHDKIKAMISPTSLQKLLGIKSRSPSQQSWHTIDDDDNHSKNEYESEEEEEEFDTLIRERIHKTPSSQVRALPRPSTSSAISRGQTPSGKRSSFTERPISHYLIRGPSRRATIDISSKSRPISATVSLAARRHSSATLDQSKLLKRFSYDIGASSRPVKARHVDEKSDELLSIAQKRQIIRPHSAIIRKYRLQHSQSPTPKTFEKHFDPLLEMYKHDHAELTALEIQSGQPNLRRASWVAHRE